MTKSDTNSSQWDIRVIEIPRIRAEIEEFVAEHYFDLAANLSEVTDFLRLFPILFSRTRWRKERELVLVLKWVANNWRIQGHRIEFCAVQTSRINNPYVVTTSRDPFEPQVEVTKPFQSYCLQNKHRKTNLWKDNN
jgi:hypothetical protein